jgi:hypothetical protein
LGSKQEDCEASLSYIVRPCLKNKKREEKRRKERKRRGGSSKQTHKTGPQISVLRR